MSQSLGFRASKSCSHLGSRTEENLVFQTQVETTSLVLCLLSSLGEVLGTEQRRGGEVRTRTKQPLNPLTAAETN